MKLKKKYNGGSTEPEQNIGPKPNEPPINIPAGHNTTTKRRGRPPKTAVAAQPVAAQNITRRRGRPPKTIVPEQAPVREPALAPAPAPAPAPVPAPAPAPASESQPTEQNVTLKRRGRPPKSATIAPQPAPVPKQNVTKRIGRPPKKVVPQPEPDAPPAVRIITEAEAVELSKNPQQPKPGDPPLGSTENPIPLTQEQYDKAIEEVHQEFVERTNAAIETELGPEYVQEQPAELKIQIPKSTVPLLQEEPIVVPEPEPEPEPTTIPPTNVVVPATEETREAIANEPIDNEFLPPRIDQTREETQVTQVEDDNIANLQIPKMALYPSLDDPEFNLKIANRKEFQDTKFLAPVENIEKEQNERCQSEFEIFPHQSFIKNFLSMQTPYNSLLVYAGLGTGKTCTAIGVAEEMRNYIKQVGLQKRILILAQPNVLDNFRLQLFDESKLKFQDGEWNIKSCVGKSILDEINPTELNTTNRQRIVQNVQAILRTFYEFKGYVKFANDVAQAIQPYPVNDSRRIRKIQSMFDNSLIIIDEVHNVRLTSDNESNMTTANYLYFIAKHARNVRFILLSATPMYNSYKEIIWLTNLMNVNDHRGEITVDQIFDKDGNFRTGSENPAAPIVGRELLKRKLTGYVSYVRGENPYSFPFRIYKSNKEEFGIDTTGENEDDEPSPPPDYPPIYISTIESTQAATYQVVLNSIRDTLAQRVKMAKKVEEEEEIVPEPVPVPVPVSVSEEEEEEQSPEISRKLPKELSKLESSESPELPKENPPQKELIGGISEIQETLETLDNIGYEQLQLPIQALNIVYGTPEDAMASPSNYVGSLGLRSILQDMKNGQFEYKDNVPHIFESQQISNYSKKISTILEKVQTAEKGIIIIYSEFLDAGVIPMALALEESGYSRYPGTRTAGGEPNRSLFTSTRPTPKKYAMITGSNIYSPNNKDELRMITSEANKNGDIIQVVLITRAGAEGIDFKNIRQIHIMEPWYNMSRIEQIIGRGVRNGSHCTLPFEDRNVEIYMHATQTQEGSPSADMYLYNFAFKKAKRIGRVSRILKQIAVDCILNKEQHENFTPEALSKVPENQEIQIQTAHGPMTIRPGDQPYTAICDYAESCNTVCDPDQEEEDENIPANMLTYNLNYLTTNHIKILQHIRQLFHIQSFYPIDILIQKIQEKSRNVRYSTEQIYYCLTFLIQNRNREFLYDKYGRKGYLINRGEIYAFQPVEISDETISVFDRTFPILFRPSKIILDVPVKFRENESTGFKEEPMPTVAKPGKSKRMAIKKSIPTTIPEHVEFEHVPEKQVHEIESRYHVLLQQIQYNLNMITDTVNEEETAIAMPSSKHTDYTFVGLIFQFLVNNFHIHEDQIMHYMTDHAIDILPLYDKLVLAKHVLLDQKAKPPLWIREYFESRNYNNGKYLMLTNEKNNIQIYVKQENEWVLGKATDEIFMKKHYITPISQNFLPRETKVKDMIGFMVSDDTKNPNTEFVFKIKDFTKETKSKNAKGENLKKAGKRRVIELLYTLFEYLNVTPQEDIESKEFNHGMLTMMVEILLRHAKYSGQGIYYFTAEEYAIVKI